MLHLCDDPICFRAWLRGRRAPGWRRLVSWGLYPALLITPPLVLWTLSPLGGSWTAGVVLAVYLHLAYFSLRSVGATVGSIAAEREQRSWDVLLSTPIPPSRLFAGKLAAALLPLLGQMLLGAPLLFALGVPGGPLSAETLGPLLALSAVLVLFYGCVGLWASASQATSARAGAWAYGILAATMVGPVFPLLVLADSPAVAEALAAANPLLAFAALIWPDETRGIAPWGVTLALYALGALGFGALGARASAREPRPAPAGARRRRRASSDAILYREALGRARAWRALLYPAVLLGPWAVISLGSRHDEKAALILGVLGHVAYFAIRSVGATVGALSGEREGRTLDCLLGTRLTAVEIWRGKLVARLAPVLKELLFSSPLWLVFLAAGSIGPKQVAALLALTACLVLFGGALGLWASARSSSTLQAAQVAFGTMAALLLGTLWLDILGGLLLHWSEPVLSYYVNPLMVGAFIASEEMGRADGLNKLAWLICSAGCLALAAGLARAALGRLRGLHRL
jgi:ABC-type Na+ efflux pump permease subunit